MRAVADLLFAERETARPDYGAWWFFAFPLAAVRRFPFPFFVRGDDVSFGLDNRFDIVTLNGIACFGEDFGAKHGPLTAYLDARYHLVQALLAPRGTASRVFWIGSRLFIKPLTSYLYSSARAVTLALRHTLAGPGLLSHQPRHGGRAQRDRRVARQREAGADRSRQCRHQGAAPTPRIGGCAASPACHAAGVPAAGRR